jgi:DNA-binding Xre family transcriptional regulator
MIRLRIKEIAEAKKISLIRLARSADVDYKTIQKLFHNPEADINLRTLDKIAWSLGVTPSDLIVYTPTSPFEWQDARAGKDSDINTKD